MNNIGLLEIIDLDISMEVGDEVNEYQGSIILSKKSLFSQDIMSLLFLILII